MREREERMREREREAWSSLKHEWEGKRKWCYCSSLIELCRENGRERRTAGATRASLGEIFMAFDPPLLSSDYSHDWRILAVR